MKKIERYFWCLEKKVKDIFKKAKEIFCIMKKFEGYFWYLEKKSKVYWYLALFLRVNHLPGFYRIKLVVLKMCVHFYWISGI